LSAAVITEVSALHASNVGDVFEHEGGPHPRRIRNVVVVNDFGFVNGGAGKVALGSARGLAARGFRVSLLCGVGPVDPSLFGVPNLSVICLDQQDLLGNPNRAAAAMQGIWNTHAAAALRTILRDLPHAHTVVHVHMWGKALSSSVVRAASAMGFPVVLTLHDFLAACPTGTLFHHPSQSICKLTPMSAQCVLSRCDARNYGHKLWRVGRQLAQIGPGRLPSGVALFLAISPLCEAVMRRHLPASATMRMVPNPIEIAQAPPVAVGDNARFAFIGRLAAEKGPVVFATAAEQAGVEAVFIGDGELRDAVQAANPRAAITGWLAPESVRAHLRGARALVLPSLWYETQGLVVAEALAMGVPAIIADTSAARDFVTDGENGLLFRSGDAADLAAKIALLRDSPEVAARMGRCAWERYWARPDTMDRHLDALEAAYAALGSPAEVSA
jgi:glycosyltransferase involved in cell wall biosynthesis